MHATLWSFACRFLIFTVTNSTNFTPENMALKERHAETPLAVPVEADEENLVEDEVIEERLNRPGADTGSLYKIYFGMFSAI